MLDSFWSRPHIVSIRVLGSKWLAGNVPSCACTSSFSAHAGLEKVVATTCAYVQATLCLPEAPREPYFIYRLPEHFQAQFILFPQAPPTPAEGVSHTGHIRRSQTAAACARQAVCTAHVRTCAHGFNLDDVQDPKARRSPKPARPTERDTTFCLCPLRRGGDPEHQNAQAVFVLGRAERSPVLGVEHGDEIGNCCFHLCGTLERGALRTAKILISHSRCSFTIICGVFRVQILVLEWNSEFAGEALRQMFGIVVHVIHVIQAQRSDDDLSNRMALVDTT